MNFNLTSATRIGINLLILLGAIIALRLGESIFVPLVIALLLATILWSSANRLHSFYRLPWVFACMISVTGLVLINLVVVGGFVLAVPRLVQDLPADPEKQKELYGKFRDRLEQISPMPLDPQYFPEQDKAYDSQFFNYVRSLTSYVPELLLRAGNLVLNWLWQFVLIMFILLFLLLEGRMLSRRVTEVFGPSRDVQAKVVETFSEMSKAVRTYLVWRTIINFALGIVVGLVYQAMGLHQSWTWALLTAVLCYIPYLGPIIAGIPPMLDAFVHVSPLAALGVVLFFTALVTFEGYLIVPVVMGRNLDLNATTVMLACLFWELVWGIPGLFLAMPLMAAIKAICDHVPGWKPWANLMSAHEPPPHREPSADPERTVFLGPQPNGPPWAPKGDKVTR